MNAMLVENMRAFMMSKSTEELIQIWRENDRTKYVEEVFEAIRQILEERGEEILPQSQPRITQPICREQVIERERRSFFSFRTLISPVVIKIIYVFGMLGLTIGGIAMLIKGWGVMGLGAEKLSIFDREIPFNKQILIGIALIVLGNLLWRLLCEGWILLFGIRDILGSMQRHLKRGSEGP